MNEEIKKQEQYNHFFLTKRILIVLTIHSEYSPKMRRINMKKYHILYIVLAFTIVLLSYSFAVAGNKDFWKDLAKGVAEGVVDDAKQNAKKEKQKEFDEKVEMLLKKLPAAAKLVVLEPKVRAPEFDTMGSDPEAEDSRKKILSALESAAEGLKDNLEEHIGAIGITVMERDAFKEIEKEIVYSQTGEVDPRSSARFGKAVGATHLLILKIVYDGFETDMPTVTFSIKITEVESSIRIGTANATFNIDQP